MGQKLKSNQESDTPGVGNYNPKYNENNGFQ